MSSRPAPATAARQRVARLVDEHPWFVPAAGQEDLSWASLWRLERYSREQSGGDRVARLVPLRLQVFRHHWSRPPSQVGLVDAYRRDVRLLIEHDVPRLRGLLAGVDERKTAARWIAEEGYRRRAPRLT
ncbi:hypothetical protein IL38_23950 [Actinopolyspora erythraea]|uniref:Uncharacterized protein n=1 Tax=Actinopolyspora erythraea TaxID=414996 RepID=A0ABR4WYA0_9ACTN|nr:hypothetical protein IL38_23950 [Actinopolyspora erythraea]